MKLTLHFLEVDPVILVTRWLGQQILDIGFEALSLSAMIGPCFAYQSYDPARMVLGRGELVNTFMEDFSDEYKR